MKLTKVAVTKVAAWRVVVTAEFYIEQEHAPTKAEVRKALRDEFVKVKSGPLDNIAMGLVTAVKKVTRSHITMRDA